MKRAIAGVTAIAILLGVVVASASSLAVESGALMVLSSVFDPPTDTPPGQAGTSIGAQTTAQALWVSLVPDSPLVRVTGEICVANTGDRATEGLLIVDQIQYKMGSGEFQDLVGAAQLIAPASAIDPGMSSCYAYEIQFTAVDGAQYRNVARVTITTHSGWLPGSQNCPGTVPCPFGPEPKADFVLPDLLLPLEPMLPSDTSEPTATETPAPTATGVPLPQPPL